jgi:hypothetical protein
MAGQNPAIFVWGPIVMAARVPPISRGRHVQADGDSDGF